MYRVPAGFVAPCLPSKAPHPPTGEAWLHEIKHDGFRKVGSRVKLYSRPGNDLTYRFPLIVETLSRLRSRSCIIDGDAVACDDDGVPSFNRIRYRRHDESVFLYAFDPIEVNGAICATTCSKSARRRWPMFWPGLATASGSMSTSRKMARIVVDFVAARRCT